MNPPKLYCKKCHERLKLLIKVTPRPYKIKKLIKHIAKTYKIYQLKKTTPPRDYDLLEQMKYDLFSLILYCSNCKLLSAKDSDFTQPISSIEEVNSLIDSNAILDLVKHLDRF